MSTSIYDVSFPVRWYRQFILQPLGLDRETAPVLWLLIFFSLIFGLSLWHFNGDVPVSTTLLYVSSFLVLAVVRPDIALYTFLFLVVLFDQFEVAGFEPATFQVMFFNNIKEIAYLPEIEQAVFNPVEFHLVIITLSWVVHYFINSHIDFRPIPVWPAFILFMGWFGLSFFYGIMQGGDFLVALWEIRAVFYMAMMYLLVPQVIRTKKQINILFWVFIAAVTIKAIQGGVRYISLGFSTGGYETLTSNEDPVMMIPMIVFLMALLVFKTNSAQRTMLFICLIPILLGFYAGQRRASYAALLITIAAFLILLPPKVQWSFLKKSLPFALVLGIYGAMYWNSDEPIAAPVQLIKSGIVTPDPEENLRHYYSNVYREIENYNLSVTAQREPVLGIGFGNAYDMPVELANISFPLRDYIPHNQLFWVYIKTGAVGFMLFFFFFNAFAFRGVAVYTRLKDPYLKAVALVVVIAVLNQLVVSYFDVMLTFYRNMIYLGCLMGLLPALEAAAKVEEEQSQNMDQEYLEEENT